MRLFLSQTAISLDQSRICDGLPQLLQAVGGWVFSHIAHHLVDVHRLQLAQKCPSNMPGLAVGLAVSQSTLFLLLGNQRSLLLVLVCYPLDYSLAILSVVLDNIADRRLVCLESPQDRLSMSVR